MKLLVEESTFARISKAGIITDEMTLRILPDINTNKVK
jgi:hypothetical protein